VNLGWLRLSWPVFAAALVSGCGASSTASPHDGGGAASATSAPLTATWAPVTAVPGPAATGGCSSVRSLPPQTMNAGGGTLSLPACGSFSGQIAYPSFGATAGTISATVQVSRQNDVFGAPAHLTNAAAFLYIGLVLSSSSTSDSSITFGSLAASAPASCGQLQGTFASGTVYFAEGEFPVPGALEQQSYRNAAGAGSWQGAGCAFDDETLTIGPAEVNVIVLSTSEQFSQ